MLIFLIPIYPTSDNMNNTTSIEEINGVKTNVKELMDEFFSVEKDFEIMENHFNEKLNTSIDEKKNNLNPLYFEYFQKKEKETESVEHIPRALSDVYCHFLEQILPGIVFDDFLLFFDEYSYVMNERIIKMYEKLKRVENTLKALNVSCVPVMVSFEYEKKIKILETAKYRDFYYFHDKLEENLTKNFKIDTTTLRSILYGCNSNDEDSQRNQIQGYYFSVKNYKKFFYACNMNPVEFFKFDSHFRINKPSENEAINVYLNKHVNCFKKKLSYLYNYHNIISETFTVSKTRFLAYEKLLNKFGDLDEINADFSEEDKALFLGHNCHTDYGIKAALHGVIFEHVNYIHGYYYEYTKKINEIKQFLQSCIRQEVVPAIN